MMGKPNGKRQLERLRRRWEGNIKMNDKGIDWEDVEWIGLTLCRNKW